MNTLITTSLCTIAITLGACTDSAPSANAGSDTSTTTASTNTGSSWILASAPESAMSVTEAKSSASEGDTIAVRARIGGRMEPITSDSAVFTVMDLAIPSCADMADDHCPTPWDYCCESPETIRANAATVQLVDESGSAIDVDPTNVLDELDEVVIVGVVGARPNNDVLTIRASGIHIVEN